DRNCGVGQRAWRGECGAKQKRDNRDDRQAEEGERDRAADEAQETVHPACLAPLSDASRRTRGAAGLERFRGTARQGIEALAGGIECWQGLPHAVVASLLLERRRRPLK